MSCIHSSTILNTIYDTFHLHYLPPYYTFIRLLNLNMEALSIYARVYGVFFMMLENGGQNGKMSIEETNSKIYIYLFIILNLFGDVTSRKSMLY